LAQDQRFPRNIGKANNCADHHLRKQGEDAREEQSVSRPSAVLIVCATLGATPGLAHAGACSDQIAQLRQAAQVDHEPTPESVNQSQSYDQLMFAAALAEAEALAADGNELDCLVAARRAKEMLAPG
jgi:hypothetical protein